MDNLNPGIIETVQWLRSKGFTTCDSGDGETHDHECDLPIPYVHMTTTPEKLISEARRLQGELQAIGINVAPQNEEGTAPSIEATWNPAEPTATISLFNVKLTSGNRN